MRGRHRLWLAAAVPLLALSLAACGGHGTKPGVATAGGGATKTSGATPTASVDQQTAMLNYARCMRDHGVNMADPETAGGGGLTIAISGGPVNEAQMKAAEEACRQYMPNGGAPPSMSPEQVEQMRKFAQCMRDHGVQMADPDPNNGGISVGKGAAPGPSDNPSGGMKAGPPNDPNFKAAEEACKSFLPKGLNQ